MQKNTCLLVIAFILLTHLSFSQKTDSTKNIRFFSGAVSVTNNGISIVPSFSLGKPAVIFNLLMGKKRFSFEPDLRFSLAGKPWSFLFWGRYKLVSNPRFQLTTGAHLGLNFKTYILPINGDSSKVTVTSRYLAGDLFPRYLLTKHISIGIYYLYSHGLDPGTIKNTNFLAFNSNFSNIRLTKQLFLFLIPQFYYLKLDKQDGFYFSATMTLTRRNFPLSVSAIINKTIQTDITGSKNFLWNASLIYFFSNIYVKK